MLNTDCLLVSCTSSRHIGKFPAQGMFSTNSSDRYRALRGCRSTINRWLGLVKNKAVSENRHMLTGLRWCRHVLWQIQARSNHGVGIQIKRTCTHCSNSRRHTGGSRIRHRSGNPGAQSDSRSRLQENVTAIEPWGCTTSSRRRKTYFYMAAMPWAVCDTCKKR